MTNLGVLTYPGLDLPFGFGSVPVPLLTSCVESRAQEGQKNANKRLVRLIHKVSREREDSDKVAAAASADADMAKAQLRNVKSKLDFPKNFTKPGSKETPAEKREINSLLKTPTEGKASKTKAAAVPAPSKVIGNAEVKVGKP